MFNHVHQNVIKQTFQDTFGIKEQQFAKKCVIKKEFFGGLSICCETQIFMKKWVDLTKRYLKEPIDPFD